MFGNESESLNSYYYFNMKNETNMWANLFIQLIKINQTKCNQISKIKCVLKRKFALFNKIWWVLDTISIISKKSNKRKSFYIKKSHITFAFAFKKTENGKFALFLYFPNQMNKARVLYNNRTKSGALKTRWLSIFMFAISHLFTTI